MDLNQLPNDFFTENPLDRLSPAYFAYIYMLDDVQNMFENKMLGFVEERIPVQRRETIQREKEAIAALSSGEAVVRYMRRNFDFVNRSPLCRKALTMQDEVIPLMLQRYRTSMQESFIETAVQILAHADQKYIEDFKALYPDIQPHYAKSTACLVFGVRKQEDMLPLLVSEYQRFHQEYSNKTLDQGPLVAIYALCEKM